MRIVVAGAVALAVIFTAGGTDAQRLSVVDLLTDAVWIFGDSLAEGHAVHAEAYDVKHHPSGRFAVVSRPDAGEIDFLDLRGPAPVASDPPILHAAWTMEFTPDGSCLIATRPDGISSFAVGTRGLVSEVETHYSTSALAVAAPAVVLVGDSRNKRVTVFTVNLDDCRLADTGSAVRVGGSATSDPLHLAVSPDGRLVVAVSRSSGLEFFRLDGTALAPAGSLAHPPGAIGLSAAFTPDGRRLYVHQSTYLRVLDLVDAKTVADSGARIAIEGPGAVGLPGPRQVVSDGRLVYFTGAGAVWAASVATNEVVARQPAGNNPAALALSGELDTGERR
jgi:hypothetical protein